MNAHAAMLTRPVLRKAVILIVDDVPSIGAMFAEMLRKTGHEPMVCSSAAEALRTFEDRKPDIILSDIKMPGMTGVELLAEVRKRDAWIPVILMTGNADVDSAISAANQGAFEILQKPCGVERLQETIHRALDSVLRKEEEVRYRKQLESMVSERTRALSDALHLAKDMSRELVRKLTSIAEFRDPETGSHIRRIGLYCKLLAEEMDYAPDFVEALTFASSMHDIGKVGISDNILFKEGPLTAAEFEIMKTHTILGSQILGQSEYPQIRMAASVALNHHERFDGGGYPRGLQGTEIPLEGRIVMIADQYDALRSARPYKPQIEHGETLTTMLHGKGRTRPSHFDPVLLQTFAAVHEKFNDIYEVNRDASDTQRCCNRSLGRQENANEILPFPALP